LLVKFPIGIKVLFTHELQKWQKTIAITDQKTYSSNVNSELKKTTQEHISSTIDLDEVLKSSSTRKMITDYYKMHNKFNNNIRTLLVDLIISHIITKKILMSVHLASNIATYIVNIFKLEKNYLCENLLESFDIK